MDVDLAKEIRIMMESVMLMMPVTIQHQVLQLMQTDVQTARRTVTEMEHSMMLMPSHKTRLKQQIVTPMVSVMT